MELMQGASLLSRPAEEFGNDELLEEMWAVKAMDHAEIHFNLLISVPPSCLRLTPYDEQIYETFRQDFPDLKLDILTDDILKSPEAKERWRQFVSKFDRLSDYSYGTLIRADATKEFSPENALLVVRIQFLAIEIARNREGLNDIAHRQFRMKPLSIEDAHKQAFNDQNKDNNNDNDDHDNDDDKNIDGVNDSVTQIETKQDDNVLKTKKNQKQNNDKIVDIETQINTKLKEVP